MSDIFELILRAVIELFRSKASLEVEILMLRHQAKGPRNIDLPPQQLAQTYCNFAEASILQTSIIAAIKSMILTDEWSRLHR